MIVIGYSFGDDYVNELIEQGFRNNSRLRIIVVAPKASESVESRPIFSGSPKVTATDLTAKEALNDAHLKRAIDKFLAESTEDQVF